MANTIRVKRGSGTPTTSQLGNYEIGYSTTGDRLYINDNGTIVDLSTTSPDRISSGYTKNNIYINTHPENNGAIIPFYNNDIAYLTYRGGSFKIYYDGVEQINTSASNAFTTVFNGEYNYWSINSTNPAVSTIVIELTLNKTFTWTNRGYIDFGAVGWGAENIKFEVINTNYADDVWTTKGEVTEYPRGEYMVSLSHTPVGASNAGGGFNKVRITLSNFRTPTNFRIAAIGIINYASKGIKEVCIGKDGGTIYGDIDLKPFGDSAEEGGEIHLLANGKAPTKAGSAIDNYNGTLRIFGRASADGTTVTGSGTPLVINPYAKTITGGYTITGTLSGNASTASTANKLANTAAIGSTTRPVYFTSGGVPATCTYTLEKSVPSNAVFTDTNTKVTQTSSSTNASYPLLLSPQTTTSTNTTYFDSGVTLNPSTNIISGADISGYYLTNNSSSLSVDVRTAGYVTSSQTEVWFMIPISKVLKNVTTYSVTSNLGFVLRQEGKYTHGSSDKVYAKPTIIRAYLSGNSSCLRVCAIFSNLTNAINNAPVGVHFSGYVNFTSPT